MLRLGETNIIRHVYHKAVPPGFQGKNVEIGKQLIAKEENNVISVFF